jgi:hypothetical protein
MEYKGFLKKLSEKDGAEPSIGLRRRTSIQPAAVPSPAALPVVHVANAVTLVRQLVNQSRHRLTPARFPFSEKNAADGGETLTTGSAKRYPATSRDERSPTIS